MGLGWVVRGGDNGGGWGMRVVGWVMGDGKWTGEEEQKAEEAEEKSNTEDGANMERRAPPPHLPQQFRLCFVRPMRTRARH